MKTLILAFILSTCTLCFGNLPDVFFLQEHETPGKLRIAYVHSPYVTPDRAFVALIVVTDSEPTVRKDGGYYDIDIAHPLPGEFARVVNMANQPILIVSGNEVSFRIRLKTEHRPTVSKRGEQWVILVTPLLEKDTNSTASS